MPVAIRHRERRRRPHGILSDRRGVSLIEFAISLPILLTLSLTGAELTNYAITRMRISQLALQIADDASRIGDGGQLLQRQITESDIDDVFTGAELQSRGLDIFKNGRVILSDLEPMSNPNTRGKYQIKWQRCAGSVTSHDSQYGKAGDTNLSGIGDPGHQVGAVDDGATMFVEVFYQYQPLVKTSLSPSRTITETASMMVRDNRDLSQIYNVENAARADCGAVTPLSLLNAVK